ncbi:GNAT family N-acetyltransferase [Salinibius halmophilus]|uniref:GNAT family N-acetyltransferase n=1 Tax=Salinibius halmophilus TaxID=1853216 RepID=UPI000E66F965|nr:GNAT family N-acetyltransferase [Salinibius halmophilus]
MMIVIRPIESSDDRKISNIIRQVGAEFGAVGEGFGPGDAEVANMSGHYHPSQRSRYYVALLDGEVVGGGGIAPFTDAKGSNRTCELRKLFLLPQARRLGIGKRLLAQCLDDAKSLGYHACYLDTLANMHAAINLYQQYGFKHLDAPMAATEHGGCDVWMLKKLDVS